MQAESPIYPHTLAQWLYIVVAWFLGTGVATALLTAWIRRRHGPAEVQKLNAETRSIVIRDDIALGELVSKLIKEVAEAALDAEERRQQWLLQEEQTRAKVLFWRSKAEELDGRLIDLRYDYAQLETREKKKTHELKVAMAILSKNEISYSELDQPGPEP